MTFRIICMGVRSACLKMPIVLFTDAPRVLFATLLYLHESSRVACHADDAEHAGQAERGRDSDRGHSSEHRARAVEDTAGAETGARRRAEGYVRGLELAEVGGHRLAPCR